jgi:suppressor of ftsI
MDLGRIDEAVTVGDVEEWEVVKDDGMPHSVHVHDVQFRVITLDGDG